MSVELEDRLERLADTLPAPTVEARERARRAAVGALPHGSTRRRRRVFALVPAAALGATVAVVAILAAPWQDSPLATERALAALGDLPVIHAIVEHPGSEVTVIDLASIRQRSEPTRSEYWYDEERNVLRFRLTVGGKLLPGGEFLQFLEGFTERGGRQGDGRPPQLDPALGGVGPPESAALESGAGTVVGEEVVDGRDAVVLRFSLRPGPSGEQISEDVAVDADDYRPLRFRFSSSEVEANQWSQSPRVVEIETIARDPRDFARPEPTAPRPGGQTGVEVRTLTPAEAATALGRPVFWPGPTVGGVELAQIELMRLTTRWTDGDVTEGHALVFQYGASQRDASLEGRRSLIVTVGIGTSPAETPRFGSIGAPPPGPDELRLMGFKQQTEGGGETEMWFGSMQREGVYFSFRSPHRELILAAARSMAPLR
jgi:hypothetical protein